MTRLWPTRCEGKLLGVLRKTFFSLIRESQLEKHTLCFSDSRLESRPCADATPAIAAPVPDGGAVSDTEATGIPETQTDQGLWSRSLAESVPVTAYTLTACCVRKRNLHSLGNLSQGFSYWTEATRPQFPRTQSLNTTFLFPLFACRSVCKCVSLSSFWSLLI